MSILGKIIKRSENLRKSFASRNVAPIKYQQNTLKSLLKKAENTDFGKKYNFKAILESDDITKAYKEAVPFHDYDTMFTKWWSRNLLNESDVAWPGKVDHFALSSGTAGGPSKYIPITDDMIKSTQSVGFKQFYSMQNFDIPTTIYEKGILTVGGSTNVFNKGNHYEEDLGEIHSDDMPIVGSNFLFSPGKQVSQLTDWNERIDMVVENAKQWDVGTMVGIPARVIKLIEKVIEVHELENIHDIWPNFGVYIHGGVAFGPYKDIFEKLLGKPIQYIDTYTASEGSFGFQTRPGVDNIKLTLNTQIYYEFVPFNNGNFDEFGDIKADAPSYHIGEVEKGVNYAIIITTCSGAWRYVLGDIVEFTDVENHEIIIKGRTQLFLSVTGEQVTTDNLNRAISNLNNALKLHIREYTVCSAPYEDGYAHHWFIGTEKEVSIEDVRLLIDQMMKNINDDYNTARTGKLKHVFVHIHPNQKFVDFLDAKSAIGGMNKFPRVLKGALLEEWLAFVELDLEEYQQA